MKRWIKRTFIGLFGASVLIAGVSAYSHGHHGRGWNISAADATQMRERLIERAGSKLDLDAAQKQRLGVLANTLQEQRKALMADTPDPRAELNQLVAGNTFDRARAQTLVENKTAAVRAKSPAVIEAVGDFFDSLRPDQQQKLRELMNQRRGHRGG